MFHVTITNVNYLKKNKIWIDFCPIYYFALTWIQLRICGIHYKQSVCCLFNKIITKFLLFFVHQSFANVLSRSEARINKSNYGMISKSKQVSLPKTSLILYKMKISLKSINFYMPFLHETLQLLYMYMTCPGVYSLEAAWNELIWITVPLKSKLPPSRETCLISCRLVLFPESALEVPILCICPYPKSVLCIRRLYCIVLISVWYTRFHSHQRCMCTLCVL